MGNPSQKMMDGGGRAPQATRPAVPPGFRELARQHTDESRKRGGEEPAAEDDEVETVSAVPGGASGQQAAASQVDRGK